MLSIDLRDLLYAFAMASGAPAISWQVTHRPQATVDEAGEKSPNLRSTSESKQKADRELMPQHDSEYLRPRRLAHFIGR
jgi:pyocin large subunit-like protein